MMGNRITSCFLALFLSLLAIVPSVADEWPAWRYDNRRSAYRVEGLPETLQLQWMRELPRAKRAWPVQRSRIEHEAYTYEWVDDEDKLDFDISYSPVAAHGLLFVPSTVHDAVLAYDLADGTERWRYVTDGPVRFAPAVSDHRVYFVSDDGFLYCVDAPTGALLWRFRGGPHQRLILGNERLIDSWPARGAPVVEAGIVYFAAGIWPFMGIFVHALDAETGTVIWTNSASGALYDLHQHGGAYSFGGVAPQGHLVIAEDTLLVAGGLTVPAAYNKRTGAFLYYRQAHSMVGKGAGGYAVSARDRWFFNHNSMYSLEDGAQFGALPASVLTDDFIVGIERGRMMAHHAEPEVEEVEVPDRLERESIRKRYSMKRAWFATLPDGVNRLHFRAGDVYYLGGEEGVVAAMRFDPDAAALQTVWQDTVEGAVFTMLAVGNSLIVTTDNGRIYCFGPERPSPITHPFSPVALAAPDKKEMDNATLILDDAGTRAGYAMVMGTGTGDLLCALLLDSALHIVAFDPDADKVAALRRQLADAGLYGLRAAVQVNTMMDATLPPYLAGIVVVPHPRDVGLDQGVAFVEKLFPLLRPYGGTAYLGLTATEQDRFTAWVGQAAIERAEVGRVGPFTTLKRVGALPDTGQNTHEHGDAANSARTLDNLVKAPLGMLWFGGPTNEDVLPRHGSGPVPQVCAGRLFILGVDTLSARDVYSGRVLWTVSLPGIGDPYQTLPDTPGKYLPHQPGAAFVGSCYVSVEDGIYVAYEDAIRRLDPATGELLDTFPLDVAALELNREEEAEMKWGHIAVWDDLLILGAGPQLFDDEAIGGRDSWNATSSRYLVVLDRYSGAIHWHRRGIFGFRHNAIATASETVFAIDGLSPSALERMERRGLTTDGDAALYALDARTGAVRWQRNDDIFGTWLGYSEEHDILIQAGRGQRGGSHGLPDEPNNQMVAHRGKDGATLWTYGDPYQGPLALLKDRIIPTAPSRGISAPFLNLLSGETIMRLHPITGDEIAWRFNRTYGCGTGLASTHLLTFRSGAAGYYDLKNDGGTGNFGGFRAGCTSNLVAADGVLNAPDYTRTCQCSYQNRTSLALVHDPEVEIWTYSAIPVRRDPVLRLGLNLGAPGDRLADTGTLWLDFPSVGGDSPDIPVTLSNENVQWFRMHSSMMHSDDQGFAWVGASGVEGEGTLTITVASGDDITERTYTVSLYFAEPLSAPAPGRVFDVSVQGNAVLKGFCPSREADGVRKTLVHTVSGVNASELIEVELKADGGATLAPVLSGIEIIVEP